MISSIDHNPVSQMNLDELQGIPGSNCLDSEMIADSHSSN